MAQSNTLLAQPASSLVAPYLATPSLVIIIDDLGNNLASGRRAVNLPGAITYAILPHTPQAIELATYANHVDVNKEVIIHMPMEAVGHKHMGPGGLNMHQDHQDFIHTLQAAIQALPQAKGLSNHMGSQLTSQPDRMHWLMSELSKTPFYFIDSKTTDNSAAMHAADEQNIP
ncbi:MAG: divergent polysaccharide deacetylase family protein, partial [Pseudomonadales bacterium]